MKSIRESLGLNKPSFESSPKSAAGILPHSEDKKINDLWIDILKSHDAMRRLHSDINKYHSVIKELHTTEEKLLENLGSSGVGAQSSEFCKITDEYLSVVQETKEKNDEIAHNIQVTIGNAIQQYYNIYEDLDNLRKRRDECIIEAHKNQERFDRLKLKMKRTTDVLVEKEKNLKLLKDLNDRLIEEGGKFHALRIPLLELSLLMTVQLQVDYYGISVTEYNNHIHLSRGSASLKDSTITQESMQNHLAKIRSLKIVEL